MKHLYKEQNTFRILPINFMHNLGILLENIDLAKRESAGLVESYYNWAMGNELGFSEGLDIRKVFDILGDTMNITDYEARLEVWYKQNAK